MSAIFILLFVQAGALAPPCEHGPYGISYACLARAGYPLAPEQISKMENEITDLRSEVEELRKKMETRKTDDLRLGGDMPGDLRLGRDMPGDLRLGRDMPGDLRLGRDMHKAPRAVRARSSSDSPANIGVSLAFAVLLAIQSRFRQWRRSESIRTRQWQQAVATELRQAMAAGLHASSTEVRQLRQDFILAADQAAAQFASMQAEVSQQARQFADTQVEVSANGQLLAAVQLDVAAAHLRLDDLCSTPGGPPPAAVGPPQALFGPPPGLPGQ